MNQPIKRDLKITAAPLGELTAFQFQRTDHLKIMKFETAEYYNMKLEDSHVI